MSMKVSTHLYETDEITLTRFEGRWGSVMIGDSLSLIITERNQGADAARTLAAALNALADNLQHGDDPAPDPSGEVATYEIPVPVAQAGTPS